MGPLRSGVENLSRSSRDEKQGAVLTRLLHLIFSDMVSKLEFQWMGGKIDLFLKIGLFIFPDIVFEEGYGTIRGTSSS